MQYNLTTDPAVLSSPFTDSEVKENTRGQSKNISSKAQLCQKIISYKKNAIISFPDSLNSIIYNAHVIFQVEGK
jgi:hypothetical protein